jgi:hypothetical protein
MNKRQLTIFKSVLNVANTHAQRLTMAMGHIQDILPLTTEKLENLSVAEVSFLDVITGRFAKLQDLINAKLFPLLLEALQEDTNLTSALDRFNKLEKLGILPDAHAWIDMRNVRNMVTHEYPDDPDTMVDNLKQIIKEAQQLLAYWQTLQPTIEKTIQQVEKMNTH